MPSPEDNKVKSGSSKPLMPFIDVVAAAMAQDAELKRVKQQEAKRREDMPQGEHEAHEQAEQTRDDAQGESQSQTKK